MIGSASSKNLELAVGGGDNRFNMEQILEEISILAKLVAEERSRLGKVEDWSTLMNIFNSQVQPLRDSRRRVCQKKMEDLLKTSNFEPLVIKKKGNARGQSSKGLRSSHHFTVRPFMGNNDKGGSEANSPRSRSNLDPTKFSSASEDEDVISPEALIEPAQDKSLMTWEEA